MEEMEQVNSDANLEVSSEPQSEPVSNEGEAPEQSEASEQQPEQARETPFHEHPRFKELVEQKNRYAEQTRALEERYAQLERQLQELSKPKTQPQEDALLARLKKIDPEFGERFEKLNATQQELAELRQWRQQQESQQLYTQAVSTVKDLHTQYKVPSELQDFYNNQIENVVQRNPNLGLKDLPNVFKAVHDNYTKLLDNIKRAERESYVKAKSEDAKVPSSQPKGNPVSKGGKKEFSSDPVVARQELISRVLKQSKESQDF